jgi:uncharacterized RDD family membrane protein YckC
MTYATLWQRFAANLIDVILLLLIAFAQAWLESYSKIAAYLLVVPVAFAYSGYSIYCHGRFGQTLGKYVMGIIVVRTTGERIGWSEAWLRSSVDVVLASLGVISSFIALAAISDTSYYEVGWLQRAKNIESHAPNWLAWSAVVIQLWGWSEVVVMLFNKKRRALHDYIAGTIVIVESTSPSFSAHDAQLGIQEGLR